MAPQIAPSKFAGLTSLSQVMAKIKKNKKTSEEIKLEGEKMLAQSQKPREWKWEKKTFGQSGLKHWGS